jgi:hypothetical protein
MILVVISDLTGWVVFNRNVDRTSTDLTFRDCNLPPGMNFVTLEIDNLKYTKRMVLNR